MATAIVLPAFNDLGRSVTPFLKGNRGQRRKSIDYRFEFFAKCTIEISSFRLFVYLCDGFKCLSQRCWCYLELFMQQASSSKCD